MQSDRWCLVWLALGGCSLDEEQCRTLRSRAFDELNGSHACRDDADCVQSEWPGCTKPLNREAQGRIVRLKAEFDDGGCKEPSASCAAAPEVYCDRQLCIFHYRRSKP